jgi:hypothetical protein
MGCRCELINFNQYNLAAYIGYRAAFFWSHTVFPKAKFCVVPSGAIVQVGCAVDKKRLLNTLLSCK